MAAEASSLGFCGKPNSHLNYEFFNSDFVEDVVQASGPDKYPRLMRNLRGSKADLDTEVQRSGLHSGLLATRLAQVGLRPVAKQIAARGPASTKRTN